tara:strand:- start:30 stop:392 length:363 start_codon:yes stop_codon:yes gene_type:complete
MLININTLKERIHGVILNKGEQGHKIEGLENKLTSINDSYDTLIEFAESLYDLPIRNDWPYVEPNSIEEIQSESDPTRHLGPIKTIDFEESSINFFIKIIISKLYINIKNGENINPLLST